MNYQLIVHRWCPASGPEHSPWPPRLSRLLTCLIIARSTKNVGQLIRLQALLISMETVLFPQKQRDFIKVFIGALAMFKKSLIVMSLWFLINHLATDEEKSSYLQYKAETKQNYSGVHSVLCAANWTLEMIETSGVLANFRWITRRVSKPFKIVQNVART